MLFSGRTTIAATCFLVCLLAGLETTSGSAINKPSKPDPAAALLCKLGFSEYCSSPPPPGLVGGATGGPATAPGTDIPETPIVPAPEPVAESSPSPSPSAPGPSPTATSPVPAPAPAPQPQSCPAYPEETATGGLFFFGYNTNIATVGQIFTLPASCESGTSIVSFSIPFQTAFFDGTLDQFPYYVEVYEYDAVSRRVLGTGPLGTETALVVEGDTEIGATFATPVPLLTGTNYIVLVSTSGLWLGSQTSSIELDTYSPTANAIDGRIGYAVLLNSNDRGLILTTEFGQAVGTNLVASITFS